MILSSETIAILDHFADINNSIVIDAGNLIKMLAAAGEGAILAGQAEPHRECSMAVSGDSAAW